MYWVADAPYFIQGKINALQAVDLGGEDEITLGESVNFVCPGRDFGLTPAEQNVRVMTLLFGKLPDLVHESEGLAKVREPKGAGDVMALYYVPCGHLLGKGFEFLAFERRNAAAARHTGFGGKFIHRNQPPRSFFEVYCTGTDRIRVSPTVAAAEAVCYSFVRTNTLLPAVEDRK
jgi:hypothetical protein